MCLVEIVGIVTLIIHECNTADSLNTAAGILSMTKTTVRIGPSGLTSHVAYTRGSAAQPACVMLSANNCSICNFAYCLSLIGKQFEIIVCSHYQSQPTHYGGPYIKIHTVIKLLNWAYDSKHHMCLRTI